MEFTYVGSGDVNIHGCPVVEVDRFIKTKFAINSKVYDMISANKGILEAVWIKSLWHVCDPRTGQKKVLYKDNTNWIHNENDLGSQAQAIAAIEAYFNYRLDDVNRALAELNC